MLSATIGAGLAGETFPKSSKLKFDVSTQKGSLSASYQNIVISGCCKFVDQLSASYDFSKLNHVFIVTAP